jgi:hypothetical protein
VSEEASYDVYVRVGVDLLGRDEFGEAVAHFAERDNAVALKRRLEARGETVRVERSIVYGLSEAGKERWFSDYSRVPEFELSQDRDPREREPDAVIDGGIEEDAKRLLREVNERQALGVIGARVVPHHVAHHAGLEADTEDYEKAVGFLVDSGLLVSHMREAGAYRISERGLDLLEELEALQERPPDAPRGEAGGASREEAPPAQEGPQEPSERVSWWRRVFGG